MQRRRSLRLVAGALVLALPLLGSCGFGKATDKVYTPGVGTNNRDTDVKVLSAVVVAAQPDSGTFLASLSNNSTTDDAELQSIAGTGKWTALTVADIDPPVEVVPRGFVNLADDGGVAITGDFDAGDFMELTLTFASGDTVTMNVPVVFACDEYAGLDTSAGGSSQGPQTGDSESPSDSVSPGEVPTEGTTPTPSEPTETSETDEATPSSGDAYDCAAVLGES